MPTSRYESVDSDWPWIWAVRHRLGARDFDQDDFLADERSDSPAQLLSYLYISNQTVASDPAKLEAYRITHILNVAGGYASGYTSEQYEQDLGIVHMVLEAEDRHGYPLLEEHLDTVLEFVQNAKRTNKNARVLIHCEAGLNRSGLLASACAMMLEHNDVLQTVSTLRANRGGDALFNESFQEQLVALARCNGLLGPRPGETGCLLQESPPIKEEKRELLYLTMGETGFLEQENPPPHRRRMKRELL